MRVFRSLVVLSTKVAMMGTTTAQAAFTIDWSSGLIASPSPHGTYVIAGVTVTLSTSGNVSYNFSAGAINSFSKNNTANGHYTITFSQPVDFSTGFGDLNAGGESAGNFSVSPSSVVINALHSWNGTTLSYNGSGNKDTYPTFTWTGITSLSFDHIYPPNAGEFRILDGTLTPANSPPTANAVADFSVNEGQASVMLDGSGSSDPDSDPLTYAWVQLSGTTVTLSDATAQQPTFNAPTVALGGETLTFELTVTANGESDTDTVGITVVNVNHPPVAEAGLDQSIAVGSPVALHGEDSFDIDNDVFTYTWVQVSGSPTVTITGADSANPTFTAPVVAGGGAPGVVATLVFELTVNDGFPQDAAAPGYTLANVVDSVTVEISNVNNDPTAAAGADQTVDEFSGVTLNGAGSSDPDSDPLTYLWQQTGGPAVLDLLDDTTATPSFIVPFVSAGGADVTFKLTVNDGYGGTATDTVVVHVQNANDPPLVAAAAPTIGSLWPPNHNLVSVGITGVSDADNNATITFTGVTRKSFAFFLRSAPGRGCFAETLVVGRTCWSASGSRRYAKEPPDTGLVSHSDDLPWSGRPPWVRSEKFLKFRVMLFLQ